MKIRTKLLGGFLLMVAFLLISSLIAYIGLTRVAAEVEAVNEEVAEAIKAFEVQSAIADTLPPVRRYLSNGNPSEKEAFTNLVTVVEDHIAEMRAMDLEGKEKTLDRLAERWVELRDALTDIMNISDPVGNAEAAARLHIAEGIADWVHGQSYTFVVISQQRVLRARQKADATVRSTLLLLVLVAGLTSVAGMTVGLAVSRSITNAVTTLTQAAERISMGELDAAVVLKSKDELGELAQSFERMRISLKAAMDRLQQQ
ncbi:MAG: HAMP domain-containing protein [Anaerolineae bacterium]|mgnify:CR=1 FL=1|nr:HAMP domain-containing protein [Anaerolineae bacterium]